MNLYPYQENDVDRIKKEWENHSSILYQLPTGGGKTVIINEIIENILDKKILILVHRQEIIFQIRDRLKQKGITVGVLIGNFEENIEADILVGSIQTVARDTRLQIILDRNFDYMIIDEAHHACSDSYIKTINRFKTHNPKHKLLGVTATPYRKDKKKLNKIFDVLIQGPTYSKLREGGFLADYICYAAKLENLSDVEKSGGDFKLSDLSKYMKKPSLINRAIEMYKDKGENKQMLVFCVDKSHSLRVKQSYIEAGYTKIAHIDSDTPYEERKQINKDYREGKINIITSVQTLTEGVDLPETGVIQNLRPTLSIVLYLQLLGRGTRLKSDRSKLIILDLSNNSYEHGLLDSNFIWNLNNDEPNPDKKINKIVGKKRGGGISIDLDEIDDDYLELEEMSHNDFLLQNTNGIQIAEDENREKDRLLIVLYNKLVKELNKLMKIEGVSFKEGDVDIINYSGYQTIKIIGKLLSNNYIEYKKNNAFLNLGWNRDSNLYNLDGVIIQGKIAEILKKDKTAKLINNSFKEMEELYNSKIDIRELNSKLEDIKKEKCIFKINNMLSNNIFIFKLNRTVGKWEHSFRDVYGGFNEIRFINEPKKFKSIDRYSFYEEVEKDNETYRRGEHNNLKQEIILDILYKNWYKE